MDANDPPAAGASRAFAGPGSAEELFKSLADAVLTIDEESRIVFANPAVEAVLGYPPEELVGKSLLTIVPERLRAAHAAGIGRYRRTGSRSVPWTGLELPALRRDGSEAMVEIAFGEHEVGGSRFFTGVLRDLSGRRRALEVLRASEQRYRQLFERNVAGVYRVTVDGVVLEVNEAMAAILGYDRPDLVAGPAAGVYFDAREREAWIAALLQHGSLTNHVQRLRRKDGEPVWVLENATLVEDEEAGSRVIVGTAVDITERRRLEENLERMAYQDALTGLPNRRLLRQMAARALAAADREAAKVGMPYLDIARFKRINDFFGHAVGDQVLGELAQRLSGCVRATDTVARMGGDEFAVLLVGLEGPEDAVAAARRVQQAIQTPFVVEGETFRLDGRIGVAVYPDHGSRFDDLLSVADLAMYQAGFDEAGIAVYRSVAVHPQRQDVVLEERLRRALEEEEFLLHYQPIFRLPDRRAFAVEALVRWQHPERGLLEAKEFISVAEHAGLVRRLDRWSLRSALRQMRQWLRSEPPDWVAVNLSPATFEDPQLPAYLARVLDDEGVSGERLAVEITEHAAMRDPERAAQILRRLRELGIRIVIDDFGRGHSSLAYLLRFPADTIKVDRFFVGQVGVEPAHERLVEGIIALSAGLGMELIAEGVEKADQVDWLLARDCRLVQGYFLGRPAPPAAPFASGPTTTRPATMTNRTSSSTRTS